MSQDPDLPGALALVAERRGETAALRLACHYGGQEIYIPDRRRLVAGHPLVDLLGHDLALALHDIFGRGHLQVPIGPLRQSAGWPCSIPADLAQESRAEIARALGVHVRTVNRARARTRAAGEG